MKHQETINSLQMAQKPLDTLIANADVCVDMPVNMVSDHRRIITFDNDGTYMTMFSPEFIKKTGSYEIERDTFLLGNVSIINL